MAVGLEDVTSYNTATAGSLYLLPVLLFRLN